MTILIAVAFVLTFLIGVALGSWLTHTEDDSDWDDEKDYDPDTLSTWNVDPFEEAR